MKHKLALLSLPLLLLSACGETTTIVPYSQFAIASKQADKDAEAVTVTKKIIDGGGNIIYNEIDYKFSFHEEYSLGESGLFILDDSTAKYECEDLGVFAGIAIYSYLAANTKASTVTITSGQVYMINPLTVQKANLKMVFDKYGFPTKYIVTSDGSNYTLNVTYTYQQ